MGRLLRLSRVLSYTLEMVMIFILLSIRMTLMLCDKKTVCIVIHCFYFSYHLQTEHINIILMRYYYFYIVCKPPYYYFVLFVLLKVFFFLNFVFFRFVPRDLSYYHQILYTIVCIL